MNSRTGDDAVVLADDRAQVGKQAVIPDGDAHHGGTEIEGEHAELEPIDSKAEQIDRKSDESDQRGANEKRTGDPVNAVEGNAVHVGFD